MEKEKIVLSSKETLDIDAISNMGNVLNISFHGGDMAALEETFSNEEVLDKIILMSADDVTMSVFKNYSILRTISKQKNVVISEITEEKADIVTISLEQKPDWQVAQESMQKQLALHDGAIMDLAGDVSDLAMSNLKEGDTE